MKRTAYVADITGQAMLHVLYEQSSSTPIASIARGVVRTSLILDDDGAAWRRGARHPLGSMRRSAART